MALLTADDVLNKKFQPTKFREGYDQDEVDDFLDEVVNTLRVVYAENAELKAQLAAQPEQAAAPVAPSASEPFEPQPPATDAPSVPAEEPATHEFFEPVTEETPEVPAEETPEVQQSAAAPVPAAAGASSEPESATGMLQLAQRLHDEYVNDGKAEAERMVTAAKEESERLTSEAEELRNRTLNQLEQERNALEHKIDELRGFERDYRSRLKSYLEGLLRDVEGPAPAADPLAGPGSTGGGYGLR